MKNKLNYLLSIVSLVGLAACGSQVSNELVEIAPNETAFLIKLEGDNLKEQNKFSSEEIGRAHV